MVWQEQAQSHAALLEHGYKHHALLPLHGSMHQPAWEATGLCWLPCTHSALAPIPLNPRSCMSLQAIGCCWVFATKNKHYAIP